MGDGKRWSCVMSITEAIKLLNLMLEPGQDRRNEAIKMAVAALYEKSKSGRK